jgi:hypothetical protein
MPDNGDGTSAAAVSPGVNEAVLEANAAEPGKGCGDGGGFGGGSSGEGNLNSCGGTSGGAADGRAANVTVSPAEEALEAPHLRPLPAAAAASLLAPIRHTSTDSTEREAAAEETLGTANSEVILVLSPPTFYGPSTAS